MKSALRAPGDIPARDTALAHPATYSVVTFGCRVNQADSLGFEQELLSRGAVPAEPGLADVVVVNTCSVTASADQAARQTIRRIARTNPSARIVVTGCYGTRRPEEVSSLPGVLRVVQNDDKPRLVAMLTMPDAVGSAWDELTSAERFGDGEGSCGAAIEPGVAGRTAFTLRVQTGCAEPCSYCIIPTTRGIPRSVSVDDVLAAVDRAAAAGFKEIALTGVHLGSYGRDLSPTSSLERLLALVASRDLLFRISSLEPMDCTPDIVSLVARSAGLAPHFHLPLQHASNRLLAAMRRPYTIEQYSALVDDIRRKMPHAAIGSDLIVGFPGEIDEEFDALAEYLEGSPLTHLHVFPYSDRPGTAAATFAGKVAGPTVRERGARIRAIGHELSRRFHQRQLGTIHRALTLEDGTVAVTGNYLKVKVPPGRRRNEWVTIRITGVGDTLTGEIL